MNLSESNQLISADVENGINYLYTVLICVGIILNTCVCIISFSSKFNSPFTILILNICIADIIVSISTLPYVYVDNTTMGIINSTSAKFVCCFTYGKGLRICALCAQILTFCISSICRFFMLRYPDRTKWHLTQDNAKSFCYSVWIMSFFLTLPNFLPLKYNFEEKLCYRDWKSSNVYFAYFYKGVVFGIAFALPVVVIIIIVIYSACYAKKKNSVTPNRQETVQSLIQLQRLRKELWGLLVPLMVAFFICLGPITIYFFITTFIIQFPKNFDEHRLNHEYTKILDIFTTCTAISDPVIYVLKGRQFRQNAIRMLFSRPNRNIVNEN